MKRANVDLILEVEVRDKKGQVIYKKRKKAKSWVKNFAEILRSHFANLDATVKGLDGSEYTSPPDTILVAAEEGNDSYGIQVGSGTGTPIPSDYKLATKIDHGTGANQLQYGAVTVESVTIEDSNISQFRVIRVFTNGSGSDITVTEIGLVTYYAGVSVLLARDLLSPSVTVPDGATLTVRYIVKVTT